MRCLKLNEAVRDGIRLCLAASFPLATLAHFMQIVRKNGEFSACEALLIERTVVRALRKGVPVVSDGIWTDDATQQPSAGAASSRLLTSPAEA